MVFCFRLQAQVRSGKVGRRPEHHLAKVEVMHFQLNFVVVDRGVFKRRIRKNKRNVLIFDYENLKKSWVLTLSDFNETKFLQNLSRLSFGKD